jgi:xanthine dehydrogenase accessory factor
LIISKLLPGEFKYIGLLGSLSKIKTLNKKLIAEGFEKSTLNKIDAPIGSPIKSKTPAEIAVSIAAKIINLKNQN